MFGLGKSSLGIGIAVSLHDRFTRNARKISGGMSMLHGKAKSASRESLVMARNFGFAAAAASALYMRGLSRAVKVGKEFDYTMSAVQAVTGATTAEMEAMRRKTLDLAGSTMFTARQIAGAEKYLGMAGFNPGQINSTIDAVTRLGAATDTHIAGKGGAADMMTNMMTAFNMAAGDSNRMADILSLATTKANIDISDLHEALKYAGSDLTSVNATFEESVALITALGNAGLRGSIGGTSIGNMVRQLAGALGEFRSKKDTAVLSQWGLEAKDVMDSKGNLKSLISIIDTIQGRLASGNVSAINQIKEIFGVRGARAFIAAARDPKLGMNIEAMRDLLVNAKSGVALEIAAKRLDNLQGDTLLMTSAWEKFQILLSDTFTPALRFLTQMATRALGFLNKVMESPVGKVIAFAVTALVGMIGALGAIVAAVATLNLTLLGTQSIADSLLNTATGGRVNTGRMRGGRNWYRSGGKMMGSGRGARGAGGFLGNLLGGPATKGLGRMLKPLGRFIAPLASGFRLLIPLLRGIAAVLTGPVGIAIGLATLAVSIAGVDNSIKFFKDLLNGLGFAFGTLMHGLWFLWDGITSLDFGGAWDRYQVRVNKMATNMGYRESETDRMKRQRMQYEDRKEYNRKYRPGEYKIMNELEKTLGGINTARTQGTPNPQPTAQPVTREQRDADLYNALSVDVLIDGEKVVGEKVKRNSSLKVD